MYEIERRFLIEEYPIAQVGSLPAIQIRQTYLEDTGEWTIRARHSSHEQSDSTIKAETTLTMKRLVGHGIRIEIEEIVPQRLYNEIVTNAGAELRKNRVQIPNGDHTIDFDVYLNDELRGLMVAEIELSSITESVIIPSWFGREITGDDEYSNHQLFKRLARD